MIKTYKNGEDFYLDNKDFLLTNKYTEVFYRYDAPMLLETNKSEYALKAYDDKLTLVVLKKEPFNLLLYGDKELIPELFDHLFKNNYEIKDYLCPTDVGDEITLYLNNNCGYHAHILLGMDFMEANEKCDINIEEVESANETDIDEIYECTCQFIKDCGLKDKVDINHLKSKINDFRIIRKDGKIISMARAHNWSDIDKKISYVFTRKEYRGKGYAKKVVGAVLNEIIDSGYIATLNVDQNNPISNRLYSSLGFKKIFSQGVYELGEKKGK